MKKLVVFFIVLSVLAGVVSIARPVQAATLIVTPTSLQGWTFNTEGTAPSWGFTTGPTTPPLGTGSVKVAISASNSKLYFWNPALNGLTIDGATNPITSLSYSIYTDPTATNFNGPFLNIYIDSDGDTGYEYRLDFAPSTVAGWQTFNALTSNNWYFKVNGGAYTGPFSYAAVRALLPNGSRIHPNLWGGVPAFSVVMGDSASSYVGYKGAFDNVTINGTTYDFELTGPVAASAGSSSNSPVWGPPCNAVVADSRINHDPARDCAAPVAVFLQYGGVHVYGINPSNSAGTLDLILTEADIKAAGVPAADYVLLGSGTNTVTGKPIELYRLATGEYLLKTYYADGKPYTLLWKTGASDLSHIES